ncbi:hypothetical protein CLOM_g23746 [Closterium sp. NIES-68]|nr:hypothetical protein CLOM_g23746 [Closterium sp. NIES-68]
MKAWLTDYAAMLFVGLSWTIALPASAPPYPLLPIRTCHPYKDGGASHREIRLLTPPPVISPTDAAISAPTDPHVSPLQGRRCITPGNSTAWRPVSTWCCTTVLGWRSARALP